MDNRKQILSLCFIILMVSGCRSTRNITYLSDLGEGHDSPIEVKQTFIRVVHPGDLLSIIVSSLSIESNYLFNNNHNTYGDPEESGSSGTGYLVDENGSIDFPLIGSINLLGLTKTEAKEKLVQKLNEQVKKPVVSIRFLNFKVTVLGEVNNPSSFNIPTDHVNVFEALGLAGDMTIYGKRENVLLIRENGGIRTTIRLNLNEKNFLSSPYYYLQPNDILYVEPDEAKASLTNLKRRDFQFGLSIGISILSIVTLLLTRFL